MVLAIAAPPQARKCEMDRAPAGPAAATCYPDSWGLGDPLQRLRRPTRSPGLTSLTSPCQSLSVRSPSMSPPACVGRLHSRLLSPPPAPVTAATPAPRSPERAGHLGASAPPPPAAARAAASTSASAEEGEEEPGPNHCPTVVRGRRQPRHPGDPKPPAVSSREGSLNVSHQAIPDSIIPRPAVREGGWRNRWVPPPRREAKLPHPAIPCQVRPLPLELKLHQGRAFLFPE